MICFMKTKYLFLAIKEQHQQVSRSESCCAEYAAHTLHAYFCFKELMTHTFLVGGRFLSSIGEYYMK